MVSVGVGFWGDVREVTKEVWFWNFRACGST